MQPDPVEQQSEAAVEAGGSEGEGDRDGTRLHVIFPLTFVASTFVPLGGLPAGLRQFAEWNPISSIAAAGRSEFGNPTATPHDPAWPLSYPLVYSLAWTLAILVVCVPLTVHRFRVRTSGWL